MIKYGKKNLGLREEGVAEDLIVDYLKLVFKLATNCTGVGGLGTCYDKAFNLLK